MCSPDAPPPDGFLEFRINARSLGTIALAILLTGIALALVDAPARRILLPVAVVANLLFAFVVILENRDRRLPVFELGTLTVLITSLYAALPLVGYWLDGLTWSPWADPRLYDFPPDHAVVAGIGWRYAAYLASFVVVYLVVRGRASAVGARLGRADGLTFTLFLGTFALVSGSFAAIRVLYGDYSFSYANLHAGAGGPTAALPQAAERVVAWGEGVYLVSKLGLLAMLVQRWQRPRWRVVLVGWLLLEAVQTVTRLGARRDLAMFLIAVALLYHQFVRPLRRWPAATAAAVLLSALLAFGAWRDMGGEPVSWTMNNEFQVLFGNALDLQLRRGAIEVPPQLYFYDFLRLVPARFQTWLPFPVVDPSEWYLDLLRLRETGVGLMFGVVAQSVIGGDWWELVARGAGLGLIFAAIHRWYARRSDRFWPTVFYLYLCIWSYYTVRATTFHILYFVVYRFLPSFLLLAGTRALFAGVVEGAPRPSDEDQLATASVVHPAENGTD